MRKMNKKGLDEDFTDIVVGGILILIVFLFSLYFISRTGLKFEEELTNSINKFNSNTLMLVYLRTPLKSKISVAETVGTRKTALCENLMKESEEIFEGTESRYISFEYKSDECYVMNKGKGDTFFTVLPSILPYDDKNNGNPNDGELVYVFFR